MGNGLKKKWGQHLLKNKEVADKIVESFLLTAVDADVILEVGPGRGSLTGVLTESTDKPVYVLDIDPDMAVYLTDELGFPDERVLVQDFLTFDPLSYFKGRKVGLIGNFPYNISGPIFFKILQFRDVLPCITGMFQREVAVRLTAEPGSRIYGVTSVLAEMFFSRKYLMTVPPEDFNPPPAVYSGVISLTTRENTMSPGLSEFFIKLVKKAFSQRRKKLKNTVRFPDCNEDMELTAMQDKRPEQLFAREFKQLAEAILSAGKMNQN